MKPLYIIALLVIASAMVGIFVLTGEYTTYEDFEAAFERPGTSYQIVGELAEDRPMHYDPLTDPNRFTFHMVDKRGNERKVVYGAPKPQDFERSEQIVLTGYAADSVFVASKILMKCPSKYVEDEVRITEASAEPTS